MIAITGATGHLGKHVINHLLKTVPASEVIALVRNPEKAGELKKLGVTVRQADYDQAATWGPALQGVKKLLLISSSEIGKRATQHQTVINAAKEAKVEHIAYTSILRADTSKMALAQEHIATEKAIQQSQLTYTFLRNGWYLENHTENLAPALQYGAINGAAKEGRFSSASREDYALAAVKVLTTSGHQNKTYELAGDTAFTLNELAQEVSKVSGKSVAYKDLSFEELKGLLVSVGLPAPFAEILADSDIGASRGDLFSDSKDLSRLIERPTTTLNAAIKRALL